MLGERPIPLEKDALRRRIFAPIAYDVVRNAALVPVVPTEAYELSWWFPLAWRKYGSHFVLVAVRSLLNTQRGQPMAGRTPLPLILQAYPFIFGPTFPAFDGPRMLDDVFPDAPTDVGATITTLTGRPSRATIRRLHLLDILAKNFRFMQTVTSAIAERDLFVPWTLRFDVEGQFVGHTDLFVVHQAAFASGALSDILEKFGAPAAMLLGLHRISLFRAGALLALARRALKIDAPDL
jgi:SapC